jgi:hypothetical protein
MFNISKYFTYLEASETTKYKLEIVEWWYILSHTAHMSNVVV